MPAFQEGQLDAAGQQRTLLGMDRDKKKFPGSREASKMGTPPGLVIALAVVGGMVIGSAGTFFFFNPSAAPQQAASPAAVGTAQVQNITMPRPQFTPAPQPPGKAPPGKVWSVEHGHWHDAPATGTIPAPTIATPGTTPTPAPATVVTPPTPALPPEKKE